MDKQERRERTFRHCVRAKRLWLSQRRWDRQDWEDRKPLGYFRKYSGAGCRGSKKGSARSSKMGSCCKNGYEWRQSVLERRRGAKAVQAWVVLLRNYEADDIEV